MYHVIQWRDEQRWRLDERNEGGYEGGDDTIASVAAAAEEAAEAKGRYEGAVSARCSSLALYATGDIGAEPPSAVPSASSSTCYATFSPFALIVSERAGLVGSETSGRFSRRAFCPVGFLFSRHQPKNGISREFYLGPSASLPVQLAPVHTVKLPSSP